MGFWVIFDLSDRLLGTWPAWVVINGIKVLFEKIPKTCAFTSAPQKQTMEGVDFDYKVPKIQKRSWRPNWAFQSSHLHSLTPTWHLPGGLPKRKLIFQPRCYVSLREGPLGHPILFMAWKHLATLEPSFARMMGNTPDVGESNLINMLESDPNITMIWWPNMRSDIIIPYRLAIKQHSIQKRIGEKETGTVCLLLVLMIMFVSVFIMSGAVPSFLSLLPFTLITVYNHTFMVLHDFQYMIYWYLF